MSAATLADLVTQRAFDLCRVHLARSLEMTASEARRLKRLLRSNILEFWQRELGPDELEGLIALERDQPRLLGALLNLTLSSLDSAQTTGLLERLLIDRFGCLRPKLEDIAEAMLEESGELGEADEQGGQGPGFDEPNDPSAAGDLDL